MCSLLHSCSHVAAQAVILNCKESQGPASGSVPRAARGRSLPSILPPPFCARARKVYIFLCHMSFLIPASEVLVHTPRRNKRGFCAEESLGLKFLRAHQCSTVTVTEHRDFVVVSILAAGVLGVQVSVLILAPAFPPLLKAPCPLGHATVGARAVESRSVGAAEMRPLLLVPLRPGTPARVAPWEGSHRAQEAPCPMQPIPHCPTAMAGGPRSPGDASSL